MDNEKKVIPLIIMITEFFRKEWRDLEMMKEVNILKVHSVSVAGYYLNIKKNSSQITAIIWETFESHPSESHVFYDIAKQYPNIQCVIAKHAYTPEMILHTLGIAAPEREKVKFPPTFLLLCERLPQAWWPYENVAEILIAKNAAELEQQLITYGCSIREVIGDVNTDPEIRKIIDRFIPFGIAYSDMVFSAESIVEHCLAEELGLKNL